MSPNNALDKGTWLYQEGRYEDALKVFEQATSERLKCKKTISFSEIVNLERLIHCLKSFRSSINREPGSCQVRRRSERFSSHEVKLRVSLRIIEVLLEWVISYNTARRLKVLHDEILVSMQRPQSVFERLPTEMQIEIFFFAINCRTSSILPLALVCRGWKELLYETPSLWSRLTFDLSTWTTQKMADTWLKRSNGTIKSLRIGYLPGPSRNMDIFRNAAKNFWSKIEDLALTGGGEPSQFLPPETTQQLRLHSIRVDTVDILRRLDTSDTRVLTIGDRYTFMELKDLAFSKLVILNLTGPFYLAPFFQLLRQNPILETLVVSNNLIEDFSGLKDPIRLPLLSRVELGGNGSLEAILRSVKVPNLRIFRLEKARDSVATACIEAILSQDIIVIHQLYLNCCQVSFDTLLALLRRSSSLTFLTLSWCTIDMNRVVNALCRSTPDPLHVLPSSIPCPRLQYLNVSWSSSLRTRALKRLVRLRCQNSAAASENKGTSAPMQSKHPHNHPLPILYLNILGCHRIPPRAVEWLHEAVPHVRSTPPTP